MNDPWLDPSPLGQRQQADQRVNFHTLLFSQLHKRRRRRRAQRQETLHPGCPSSWSVASPLHWQQASFGLFGKLGCTSWTTGALKVKHLNLLVSRPGNIWISFLRFVLRKVSRGNLEGQHKCPWLIFYSFVKVGLTAQCTVPIWRFALRDPTRVSDRVEVEDGGTMLHIQCLSEKQKFENSPVDWRMATGGPAELGASC